MQRTLLAVWIIVAVELVDVKITWLASFVNPTMSTYWVFKVKDEVPKSYVAGSSIITTLLEGPKGKPLGVEFLAVV